MSRIGAGECGNMHMEWYGVDKKGNVAVFCSGGEGNLPEFVCESEERADELITTIRFFRYAAMHQSA